MFRVKCYPTIDFIYGFLQTKSILMTDSRPHILHYCGKDINELKKLVKEDKPDFLITHSIPALEDIKIYQAFIKIETPDDLHRVKKAFTNNFKLCKLYLETIGLQAEIIIFKKKEEKKKTIFIDGEIKTKSLISIWEKFKKMMLWE